MSEIKERDKSKKRDTIMRGAEDVFLRMGYERASMDAISECAGVSKRTVYNHFGSKEKLFEAIVYDLLSQRRNLEAIRYDAAKPLKDQLRAFAEAEIYLIDTKRRLDLSRFLTITFLKDLDFQRKMVAKFPNMYGMLIEWLAAAREDGRIRTDNVPLAARLYYAMVTGAITWPAMFMPTIDVQASSSVLSEVIDVFLARYGAPDSAPDA